MGAAGALITAGLLSGSARAESPEDPVAASMTIAAERSEAGKLAARLEAQGRYEEAADAYAEALVATGWRGGEVSEQVARLIELRLALGASSKAVALVAELERRPSAVPPATLALMVLRLAELYQRDGGAAAASQLLGPERLAGYGAAPVDLRVRLHAARARALLTLGRRKEAQAEYARVEALWPGHSLAISAIRASVDAEPPVVAPLLGASLAESVDLRVQRRLAAALESVSEAIFRRADGAVTPAATAPPPRYFGTGDEELIRRFFDGAVKRWMQARHRAIAGATTRYKAVVDLQPVPSPVWVIEVSARVGDLWGGFATALQQLPIPPSVRDEPALARQYRTALAEATAPWLTMARGAMDTCVGYAARFQIASPASARCAAWLSRSYPERYPSLDELRPAAGWRPPLRPRETPCGAAPLRIQNGE